MKEIDLLPEWYKSGKRRQVGYRAQYIALGGMLLLMAVWNLIAACSISKATAELAELQRKEAGAASTSKEFSEIKSEVTRLQKRANILVDIDSKINVGNVLAELSFLIDERIVLGELELAAERFVKNQKANAGGGSAVRVARASLAGKETLSFGDVRFKVVISGVAADVGEVAKLICKLEDSPYFCQVMPLFSRSRKITVGAGPASEKYQVSEFEISCYLANYREEEKI